MVIKVRKVNGVWYIVEKLYGTYKVVCDGGEEVVVNEKSFSGMGIVPLPGKPLRAYKLKEEMILDYAINRATGEVMSAEEYMKKKLELESRCEYDEESGIYIFETREDKLEYEKFKNEWKPVYKEVVFEAEEEILELSEIEDVMINEFIYVKVNLKADISIDEMLGEYYRIKAIRSKLDELAEKYGVEVRYPGGEVIYAELEGREILPKELRNELWKNGIVRSIVKYLKEMYEKDMKVVEENFIKIYAEMVDLEGCMRFLLMELDLDKLIGDIRELDVKKSCEPKKRVLIEWLEELREKRNKVYKEIVEKNVLVGSK
jgi:hypothetical protein